MKTRSHISQSSSFSTWVSWLQEGGALPDPYCTNPPDQPPFGKTPNFVKRSIKTTQKNNLAGLRMTYRFLVVNSYPIPAPLSEILYLPLSLAIGNRDLHTYLFNSYNQAANLGSFHHCLGWKFASIIYQFN